MIKGIDIEFKNKPNADGTLSSFTIKDCLISQNGAPGTRKPQVTIHLPKGDSASVDGAWLEYAGNTYHVIGEAVPSIKENTPTRWDRFAIAEKIY